MGPFRTVAPGVLYRLSRHSSTAAVGGGMSASPLAATRVVQLHGDAEFSKGSHIRYDKIQRLHSKTDRTCQFSLAHKN